MKEGLPKSLRPAWERVLQTVQGAVAGGLQDETEARAGSIAWQVEEGVEPDLLERLGRAVSESRELRITYWNAARNELGPRRCVPRKLAQHKGRWYLVAWDLERQAERQFRVDRVLGMDVVGPAGEGGPAQAAAGRRKSLRRDVLFDGDGDGVTARVRFDAADWDKARRFFRGAEADGGAERVLRLRSATLPTLLRSLFTFGEGWELLEPEEGRVMLRDWTASATA
jgi:predicted DNA-binding transcriptional regulator YafY